ncbi:MAG: ACP S-malonyltransferase [Parachlamydiaceae bacterium]|nr:ACP S-malonyltransferase [Parachlamydiaceae bacterium]
MNDACEAARGAMAVILGLDAEVVEAMVKEVNLPNDLWAANYNCPGQVVISGTPKGIEAGSIAAKAKGAKRVLPLPVHGAFHSGLMKLAEDRLSVYIENASLKESGVELVMNVTGAPVLNTKEIRLNLIKQVTQAVRWEQGIRYMMKAGVEMFVELGCGKALSGFNKRIGVTAPCISLENIKDIAILEEQLKLGTS